MDSEVSGRVLEGYERSFQIATEPSSSIEGSEKPNNGISYDAIRNSANLLP